MKILLVNGPPRSGKDTMGGVLSRLARSKTKHVLDTKLAKALKEMAHDALCRDVKGLEHDAFEDCKDKPQRELNGRTWREVYIAFSESLCKPLFGQDYWARRVLDEIEEAEQDYPLDYVVITDCGFQVEVDSIVDWAAARGHQVVLLRMHRAGCDFSKDSRQTVDLRGRGTQLDVSNNGAISNLDVIGHMVIS